MQFPGWKFPTDNWANKVRLLTCGLPDGGDRRRVKMLITVQAAPKEGGKAISMFVYSLLAAWGIPAELSVEGDTSFEPEKLRRKVRKIADRLEAPIMVTSEVVLPPTEAECCPWTENLIIDDSGQVIVKGTWVTVGYVVSLIIDGYSWPDILRTHPELCEADIRACLSYATQEEWLDTTQQLTGETHEHHQKNSSGPQQEDAGPANEGVVYPNFADGYVRITGKPHPVGWRETFRTP